MKIFLVWAGLLFGILGVQAQKADSMITLSGDTIAPAALLNENPHDEVYLEFLDELSGKPPMRYYDINLKIRNNGEKGAWYLFPWNTNGLLPDDGRFVASRIFSQYDDALTARRYSDGKHYIIAVELVGATSFMAFYLPPGVSFELKGYKQKSWADVNALKCIRAKSLFVNDKTELKKWLPMKLQSGQNFRLGADAMDYENLTRDPNTLKLRKDFPTDMVYSIFLRPTDIDFQWEVPLSGKP